MASGLPVGDLKCPLCQITIPSGSWGQHLSGGRHHRYAARLGVSPLVQPEQSDETISCDVCNRLISKSAWSAHTQTQKHKRTATFSAYKAALDEAEQDKNGITIPVELDFGIVEKEAAERGVTMKHSIKTTATTSVVTLIEATLSSAKGRNIDAP
jgi:helicase MOV-10